MTVRTCTVVRVRLQRDYKRDWVYESLECKYRYGMMWNSGTVILLFKFGFRILARPFYNGTVEQ
jgi:hypothetical protein